jgi:hypothetical protein
MKFGTERKNVAKTVRYLKVMIKNHPLAHTDGQVYVHRYNLFQKIGGGSHACHHCSTIVTWNIDLCVDHLDGNSRNNNPDNLVPSCNRCNTTRYIGINFLTHFKCGHEKAIHAYINPSKTRIFCRTCSNEKRKIYEKTYKRKQKTPMF